MDPVFIAWLKANDYSDADVSALTDKKKIPLLAAWEASKATPPPIALPVKAAPGNDKTPEQLAEEQMKSRRRLEVADDERIGAIRKICATEKYTGATMLIDDPAKPGTEKEVPILSHAIAEGWTPRQTELECKRSARPKGPIGVFAHSHDEDCTLEALQCAMLLKSDPSHKTNGPRQDIFCHPVYKTPMALAKFTNHKGEEEEMIPAFLRAGINAEQRQRALEAGWKYREMSVVDLCAEALRLDGRNVPSGRSQRIRAAFSGSALNSIFTTNINTILLATYGEAEDFTEGWTSTAEVNDFKLNERTRLQKGGPLAKLPRGGEADHTSRTDTEETYKVQRYARQFVYDDQDAIDDQWNAFADIPIEMGNASGRMRPSLVAAIMLANPNLNETGTALFLAGQNLNTASALSLTTFQTACINMRKVQENSVNLDLQPTHVVLPSDLDFAIDQILHSGLIVTGATTFQGNLNPTLKVKADPRPTPYLSNGVTDPNSGTVYPGSITTWYLVSANAHTIEVGYLKGTGRAPQMRSWMLMQGKYGVGYDVNLDIGAIALDWRGFQKNTA